jgi:hypothetical protein
MTPAPTGQSAGYDPARATPQLLIDPQMLFNCADAMQMDHRVHRTNCLTAMHQIVIEKKEDVS